MIKLEILKCALNRNLLGSLPENKKYIVLKKTYIYRLNDFLCVVDTMSI